MVHFPITVSSLGNKYANSGGYHVIEGVESTSFASIFLYSDWAINNVVVWFL